MPPLSQLDFSKYTCLYFKGIVLELTKLHKLSSNLEIVDPKNQEETMDPFAKLATDVICRMKIIKETYGMSTKARVPLFYVIFQIMQKPISNNIHTEGGIDALSYMNYSVPSKI